MSNNTTEQQSVYEVLMDLPYAPKGTKLTKYSIRYECQNILNEYMYFTQEVVEGNPTLFKKLEPEPKPEWEILEFKGIHTEFIYKLKGDEWLPDATNMIGFHNTSEGIKCSGALINSVKRLRDNCIFSIGDEVFIGGENRKIIEFFIEPASKVMYFKTPVYRSWTFRNAKKINKEETEPIKQKDISITPELQIASYDYSIERINNYQCPITVQSDLQSAYIAGALNFNSDKKYTEKELFAAKWESFYAGKEAKWQNVKNQSTLVHKYPTFTDYINNKNK